MIRIFTAIVLAVALLGISPAGAGMVPEPDDSVCPPGWIDESVGVVEFCRAPDSSVIVMASEAWLSGTTYDVDNYPVFERAVAKDHGPPLPDPPPRYRTPRQDGGSGHHFQHQHHGTEGPSRRTTKISWQSVVDAGTKSTFKSVWNAWVNSGQCHDSYPPGAEGRAEQNCITFT